MFLFKKNKVLLFLLVSFLWTKSFSQTYFFKNYTIEDGLAQAQVLCIHQDQKGYLWIGTNLGGVSKFDGITFKNYSAKNGLASNFVYCIAEDKEGNLWFGTSNGLSWYDGKEFKSLSTKEGLINNVISCLMMDGNGKLWVGTPTGICSFDGKKITVYDKGTGLTNSEVKSILEDDEHNIWIATYGGGICKLLLSSNQPNDSIFTYYNTKNGLPNDTVSYLMKDKSGKIWAGTKNGFAVFSENKWTSYNIGDGFSGGSVINTIEDGDGRIWLTTDIGVVNIFHPDDGGMGEKKFIHITSKDGLPEYNTNILLKDRENNIWLGSDGGGLLKFGGEAFVNVTTSADHIYDAVFPIFEKSENEYWFGTYLGGILKYDGKKFSGISEKDGLPGKRVNEIIRDRKGNIWVGTFGGISKFDGTKWKNYTVKDGLVNERVYTIYEDRDGMLWICTKKGLSKFDGNKFTNFTEKEGLFTEYVQRIVQDKGGNYWIASRGGGLCKFNGTSFKFITTKDGLSTNDVVSMLMDKEGNLWLGTVGGGINQYIPPRGNEKKGLVEKFNSDHGLFDDVVIAMTFDKDGNIWAATNKGIDKLHVNEFKKTGKKRFTHYGKNAGFLGLECNLNGASMDSKGNLWFGTIHGAIKYNPNRDMRNTIEPKTYITSVKLFFEDFNFSKYADYIDTKSFLPVNLELPYKLNHLTFNFIGISLTNSEKVQYSYMLDGLENKWSPPSSTNQVTFSSLPTGEYTFMVKAQNNDGVWNKNTVVFSFTIKPPFWRTWWFYLLVISVIIGGIRWRIESLKREKIVLEKKVREKTKELRDEKARVEEINREVISQKSIIEKKNKDITASIQYAKRIQETTLPLKEKLNKYLTDSFILFKPRDIVSGDFYWFAEKNGKIILAAVDCTGHGVPGAFMSLIGNNLLNDIILKNNELQPASILKKLDEGLITVLKKDELDSFEVDGMDIVLCVIDKHNLTIEFAAAGRSLLLVRNKKIIELKGNKLPLGLFLRNELKKAIDYKSDKISIQKNDSIYIFSDGFCDQFSGKNGDKFMYGRFEELLVKNHDKPMREQEKILFTTIEEWRSGSPQIDDMLVIGVRV